ncbi:hypothetical protein DERF_013245 [Dermatophagoides farinae]|uniref:EB domain-containing protein n=1 Tax=Dermatophagoides farinae TaxID=6954 RepID=A0A922HLU3_DERFA|nr:hypothetical protein DERF_013245 [Dermatophagoides farinae]
MATIPEYNHHNHIHYSSSSSSSSKSLLNTTNSITTTTTITPSHHTISHHRQQCENSSDCDSNLICHNHTCLCSLGQVYFHFKKHIPSDSKGMCIYYEQALSCANDDECQDIDINVVCDHQWGRCRCRRGFFLNAKTKYCQKARIPYIFIIIY